MVQWFEDISEEHAEWIKKQKMFFVATAPLDGRGTVNCSPKGHDSLRVLSRTQICYLELSGVCLRCTAGHFQADGKITQVQLTKLFARSFLWTMPPPP